MKFACWLSCIGKGPAKQACFETEPLLINITDILPFLYLYFYCPVMPCLVMIVIRYFIVFSAIWNALASTVI